MSDQTVKHNVSTSLISNAFTKTGYTFNGWNTRPDGSGTSYAAGASVTLAGNILLYAQWSVASYTLSYVDPKSGTVSPANPTSYNIQSSTITLTNPTKEGYKFIGWSGTDIVGNANTSVKIPIGSEGNRGYVANWGKVVVTFDANGGHGVKDEQTISYNTSTSLSANSTIKREGYTFNGWNTKADGSGTPYAAGASVTLNADITLYAVWT